MMNTQAWRIIQVALHCLLSAVTLLGNGAVVITILRIHYLKTVHNRHLVSLAFVDMLMGCVMLYYVSCLLWSGLLDVHYTCIASHVAVLFVLVITQMVLVCAAIDCYLSLWYPIKYMYLSSAWRVNIALCCAWIYATVITVLPFFVWNKWEPDVSCDIERVLHLNLLIFHLGHFTVSSVAVLAIFLCIGYELRKEAAIMCIYKQKWRQRQVFEERRQKDVEHAKALTLIALLFFVSWLFYVAMLLLHIIITRTWWSSLMEELALLITIIHSALNPFVYYWKLKAFHLGFYKLFCCCVMGHFPERPAACLNSVAFRNHVTGSMLNLHTTLDGKVIKVPRITTMDHDQVSSRMDDVDFLEANDASVWCSSRSLELLDYRPEIYSRNKGSYTGTVAAEGNDVPSVDALTLPADMAR